MMNGDELLTDHFILHESTFITVIHYHRPSRIITKPQPHKPLLTTINPH